MYTSTIPGKNLDTFRRNLEARAYREPLDVTYHCDIAVNGIVYRLSLLVERRRLHPYQAVRLDRANDKNELITKPAFLAALTEILIEQWGKEV